MAKQSGIHQLNGKIRGMSYYRQKGVEEGLARSINAGLSKRVKEDAAYLNTRLNAREFGSAGSFAGACIRAISERQRTMLKDFATGACAKVIRDIIIGDKYNPWGERQLVETNWQKFLLEVLSSYAKVDFAINVGGAWEVSVAVSEGSAIWTPNAKLPAGWGTQLAAKGATGATVDMYAYKVKLLDLGGKSLKGDSSVALVGSVDASIGVAATIKEAATIGAEFTGVQEPNTLQGVLVVVKPYQEINSVKYIRQELCTFAIFEVQTA